MRIEANALTHRSRSVVISVVVLTTNLTKKGIAVIKEAKALDVAVCRFGKTTASIETVVRPTKRQTRKSSAA